jgi:uncharacterized protein (TIGR00299 family) protein
VFSRSPGWFEAGLPTIEAMRIHLNLFGGVAGDMLVAGLLDAGAPEAVLREVLDGLPQDGQSWELRRDHRQGIAGLRFLFQSEEGAPHRHLADVMAILAALPLTPRARTWAEASFRALAEAEGKAHGLPAESVHFHEVGAMDAMADIAGASALLDVLDPEAVWATPIPVGSGEVRCAHGRMPVPAPGTMFLLEGLPQEGFDLEGERATPTGVALLRGWGVRFGSRGAARHLTSGYGLGTRDPDDRPNLLRVELEEVVVGGEWLVQLRCLCDDLGGELLGDALEALHAAGAVDAFALPATAKKGRPAFEVVVLAEASDQQRLAAELLRRTGSLGLRIESVQRERLPRRVRPRETPWGPLDYKEPQGEDDPEAWSGKPEFEQLRRLAEAEGLSPREMLLKLHPPAGGPA